MNKDLETQVEELYWDFIQTYSYISVGRDVVKRFINENGLIGDREYELDLLRDFILSQGLADDVQE